MELHTNDRTGIILLITAAVVGVLVGFGYSNPAGPLAARLVFPGTVLVRSFGIAAWWGPLFLLILTGIALSRSTFSWSSIIILNYMHLPVLTMAVMYRLITAGAPLSDPAPLIYALDRLFTRQGALLITSLLLAVEGAFSLQLWRMLSRREEETPDQWVPALPAPLYREQWTAPEAEQYGATVEAESEPEPEQYEPWEPPAELTLEMLIERLRPDAAEPLAESDPLAVPEPLSPAEPPSAPEPSEPPVTIAEAEDAAEDPEDLEEQPIPFMLRARRGAAPVQDKTLDDPEDEILEDEGYDDEGYEDEDYKDEEDSEDAYEDFEVDDEIVLDDEVEEEVVVAVVPRRSRKYGIAIEGILMQYSDGHYWEIDDTTREAAEVLRVTLEEFGIRAEVTGIRKGPVITMFEILPAPGVKLTRIVNLSDNIALRLAASSVRIVAPIPGKHAVGIEIPNRERHLVSFAELLQDDEFFGDRQAIPIALGKDISGEAQIMDLTKTPHLLIAGATGSGKSVCVNSIISSILYRRSPQEVKMILIDPKIVELKFYNDIPHLLTPVITDPKRAFQALQYLIYEMERRYSLLDSVGARDITGFNHRIVKKNLAMEPLPYIVVIIDEFADLMATSGKELESTVARLAAMSRAVGIHLVLATQRPSTDVITGLIKANIPARIAFMVASKVDSRIILDAMGADKLLGRGDMLFTSAAEPFPIRMQGAYLSEDEVERVVEAVKEFGAPEYIDDEIFIEDDEDDADTDVLEDPLMERAIEVVTTSRKASASYLQRRLKIGYNRAARMVEEMERMGIVGPQNGSKPRDVISAGV